MIRAPRSTLAMVFLVVMGGCSRAGVDAPSLAPRPIERMAVEAPDPAAEPVTPVDAAMAARLAAIVAAAEAGNDGFARAQSDAERAVGRAAGSGAGSEPWLAAQQALAGLDAARGRVQEAQAALDTLRGEPANLASGNRAAIEAASARIDALAAEQERVTTALTARLR